LLSIRFHGIDLFIYFFPSEKTVLTAESCSYVPELKAMCDLKHFVNHDLDPAERHCS